MPRGIKRATGERSNLRPSEICVALILSNGVGAAISVRRKSTQLNGRSGSPGVGIASLGRRQEPARENLVLGTSLVTQLFLAVFPDCRAQHKAIKGAATGPLADRGLFRSLSRAILDSSVARCGNAALWYRQNQLKKLNRGRQSIFILAHRWVPAAMGRSIVR